MYLLYRFTQITSTIHDIRSFERSIANKVNKISIFSKTTAFFEDLFYRMTVAVINLYKQILQDYSAVIFINLTNGTHLQQHGVIQPSYEGSWVRILIPLVC